MRFNLSTLANWLDRLWPERCAVCRRWGAPLCPDCLERLPAAPAIPEVPGALALFNYENKNVRQVIWQLKYRGRRRLAEPLAAKLAELLLEPLAELETLYPPASAEKRWLLVPVPLAPGKHRRRGFNQTEELGKALAALHPAVFKLEAGALRKIRETISQTETKSRAARALNIKNAFQAPRPLVGQRVILLDDVITTGATAREALKVLRIAGAQPVIVAALAHGE
jgi:ComF family protein